MNRGTALQTLLRDPRLWRGASTAPLRAAATGHAALDAVLPGGGWPLGAVSEILHPQPGVGELSLALPLLARLTASGRSVAFIAPHARPYAPALAAAGVVLPRLLVVEPADPAAALWAAEQLLHARAGAVLLWCSRIEPTALRRLQLAAETGGGIGLLYRPPAAEREASVAALRLRLEPRDGARQVTVLKCRGTRPAAALSLDADTEPAVALTLSRRGAAARHTPARRPPPGPASPPRAGQRTCA